MIILQGSFSLLSLKLFFFFPLLYIYIFSHSSNMVTIVKTSSIVSHHSLLYIIRIM